MNNDEVKAELSARAYRSKASCGGAITVGGPTWYVDKCKHDIFAQFAHLARIYDSPHRFKTPGPLQLNRGEHRHSLTRWIFFADQGEFRTGDYQEIMNKASCLSLVSNAILVWKHAPDFQNRRHSPADGHPRCRRRPGPRLPTAPSPRDSERDLPLHPSY